MKRSLNEITDLGGVIAESVRRFFAMYFSPQSNTHSFRLSFSEDPDF